jgi:trk system potassium uptake protein TrkA
MNIIILGAGRVGSVLAEHLNTEEGNNITVVDNNREKLDMLLNQIDVQTVLGEASYPRTLLEAGCETCDLLIAVSKMDEMNLLSCKIANKINPSATKVCRVRSQEYWDCREMLDTDSHGKNTIDSFISPQRLVTRYIERLLETPGALQSVPFADGLLRLIVVQARQGGLLVGKKIMEIKQHLPPNMDARIVAIYRKDASITPDGAVVIEDGDEISFIAETKHISKIMGELRKSEQPYKKITIAGGGLIGYRLAQALEKKSCAVKLLERNKSRLEAINQFLPNTVMLWGDATNPKLLLDEHINDSDAFIAVTNSDECNILSSMLAKSFKTKKVMTLVNRPEYVSLLENSQIDVAISPDLITISSILRYVRSDAAMAHSLRKGAAEALEVVIPAKSKVVGKRLDEIDLATGITIGALIRKQKCIIAHRYVVFEKDDHVIIFVNKRKLSKAVKKLFGTV